MRRFIFLSLLGLSAGAFADTLINIPIGRKVPYGDLRLESFFQPSNFGQYEGRISYGIDTNFDAQLTYINLNGQDRAVTGNLSYNYVAPITGISPGISFGVMDVANRTQDGRRFYAATTYKVGGADLFNPVELSFGAAYTTRPIGFIGLVFPFTDQLRLLGEDDGRRVSAGIEWRQNDSLSFRYLVEDSKPLLSVRWQTHL